MTPSRPHKLDLYRLAVQWPQAEAHFLLNTYAHYHRGAWPTRLKEDFAGTAAVAAAWTQLDDDQHAIAVDAHGPTVRRAQRMYRDLDRLKIIQGDVLDVSKPKVDIVAALNFSTFIYHEPPAMLRYMRHTRASLRDGGLLILDVFGGPGAMRAGVQTRDVRPPAEQGVEPFEYQWEQRGYDAVSGRIDCRIHFRLADGVLRRDAFRYDWRLWTLPELRTLLGQAGFTQVDVWCDGYDTKAGSGDGDYRPMTSMPPREDWVAYVVAVR
jgi:SAM-dependent methyltransferase